MGARYRTRIPSTLPVGDTRYGQDRRKFTNFIIRLDTEIEMKAKIKAEKPQEGNNNERSITTVYLLYL